MAGLIAKIVSWFAGKAVVYVVILALLLVIFLVSVLPGLIVKHHERELEQTIKELGKSKELAGELAVKMEGYKKEMDGRVEQLKELERDRKALDAFWKKVKDAVGWDDVGERKKRIEEQERELLRLNQQTSDEMKALRVANGESEEEIRRRELLKEDKERQLRDMEGLKGTLDRLVRDEFLAIAKKAFWILLSMILAPIVWKFLGYYVVAPLIQSAKPILLVKDENKNEERVSVVESKPAQRLSLSDGEVMLTKVDYLQGSMGDFEKRTKWLFDWNYPFTSLAAGMYILTRITKLGVGRGEVTLSTKDNATEELAVLEVPKGVEMVIRPRFLVGLIHPAGMVPRIRSRWVFGRLHSWINLQFRYLLVQGPVRMVFAGQRGIQDEEVVSESKGRRVNSMLTVGFNPRLQYSPRRAETFIAYFRGKNGLFDDFFEGDGLVLQQQVIDGKGNFVARTWEGFLNAIGKVFGI